MKIELLTYGAPECPLIRIFDFDVTECAHLQRVFQQLASSDERRIALHDVPGIEAIAGCMLTLVVGPGDFGIRAAPDVSCQCVLTKDGWSDVAELAAPFTESAEAGHFQWLDERGGVSLLLSPDGMW